MPYRAQIQRSWRAWRDARKTTCLGMQFGANLTGLARKLVPRRGQPGSKSQLGGELSAKTRLGSRSPWDSPHLKWKVCKFMKQVVSGAAIVTRQAFSDFGFRPASLSELNAWLPCFQLYATLCTLSMLRSGTSKRPDAWVPPRAFFVPFEVRRTFYCHVLVIRVACTSKLAKQLPDMYLCSV